MDVDSQMEEASAPRPSVVRDDIQDEESSMELMEQKLRKNVRGNSHAALQLAVDIPGLELDVPLCRMLPMLEVRKPLKTDINKLMSEFTSGYRRASACFYLSLKNFAMEEATVTDGHRATWSPLWRKEDEEFEARLRSDPRLEKYSDKFLYIWDGNHRHLAWMEAISTLHPNDPSFHLPVRSVMINATPQNCHSLLHAMTEWNK